jgi:hypothetical protein
VKPLDNPGTPVWERLGRTIADASSLIASDTAELRSEGLRYVSDLVAAGIVVCVEHADPYRPEFGRMIDHTMKWGLDAPDCLYLYATIAGDCEYRIHGNRGSAHHVDIQANWGHYAEGDISKWGTISSISSNELSIDDDGRFELFVGATQRGSNWLPLADNAEFLLIRQYFADWNAERAADVQIERVGGPNDDRQSVEERLSANVGRLCDWITKGGALWQQMSRALLEMAPNTVFVNDPLLSGERGGMRDQVYCLGNFCCRADEAVVIELAPPDSTFWSISLANRYWQSLDYATRQSSLNMHQAALEADGTLRVVICHDDPGVANWLDPCGQTTGTLAIRFLACRGAVEPSIRSVARNRLATSVAAASKLVTPEQRAAVLAQRNAGVRRRFRR